MVLLFVAANTSLLDPAADFAARQAPVVRPDRARIIDA
ncbi:hypothetical protein I603_1711 [Erythrobacter dokdonensis DSW-74]|uniref:Uncharacterized protein n=1 Tax=Erythrobacter dokdonensis DSW-74 TaxID=1300349 RepID=A0A1A7BFK3_9SPHN|nr:hypothetical protein I603_1711 [Erythrobacter dokdonensis DSW-74]